MSTHAMSESFQPQSAAQATIPASRVFYWSVRRELWENRSIFIAPLAVAGVALVGFSLSSIAGIWEKPLRLDPAKPRSSRPAPAAAARGELRGGQARDRNARRRARRIESPADRDVGNFGSAAWPTRNRGGFAAADLAAQIGRGRARDGGERRARDGGAALAVGARRR